MLRILLKKQMTEAFRGFFFNAKKNKSRTHAVSMVLITLYAVLMVVVLGGMFSLLSAGLCAPLAGADLLWLYYSILAMIALLLGVFGSVFNTFAGLYQGKDNDLLLSLPIPVRYILFARLLGVYLMGLMFSGVVLLPAWIVRLAVAGFTAPAFFGGLLLIVVISSLVFVLSCLLGWVVAKITSKLKNKSFLTVLIALVGIVLYYVVYFKGVDIVTGIMTNPEGINADAIKGKAYPFYLIGRVGEGRPLACLIVIAVIAAAVALTYFVLDRTFLKIATTPASSAKRQYREKKAQMRPLWLTALLREAKRFTSNAGYMLNLGLSTILCPALGIFLLVKGSGIVASLSAFEGMTKDLIGMGLAVVICLASSMNAIAEPSVSLEGKGIDVIRSLPVPTKTVLLAKAGNQALFTLPAVLLTSLFGVIALHDALTVPGAVFVFVIPALYTIFLSLYDLTLGLLTPNLNWTNEITVIKQGLGIIVALLSGFILPGLLIVGAIFLPFPALVTGLLFSAVLISASAGLYFAVTTWGVKVFEKLS